MKLKRIVSLAFAMVALAATTLYAQPGGGGGMGGPGGGMGGGPGGQGGPRMQQQGSSNPLEAAGYFEIDENKAIKKSKIKDKELQFKARKVIAQYIIGYGDVGATYSAEIEYLETLAEELEEAAAEAAFTGESTSQNMMRERLAEILENTMPIRKAMTELHTELDTNMKALLEGTSSLEKWNTYYKELCEEMGFVERKRPEGGMGQRGQMGGQMGGGMGGQMGGRPMM